MNMHDFIGELAAIAGLIALFLSIRKQFSEEREKREYRQDQQEREIQENRHQIDLIKKDVSKIDKLESKIDKIHEKINDIKTIMERDHANVFSRLNTLEERGCKPKVIHHTHGEDYER